MALKPRTAGYKHMLTALEKSLKMGREQVREKDINSLFWLIKAMLSEFGNEMPEAGKSKDCKQLYMQ